MYYRTIGHTTYRRAMYLAGYFTGGIKLHCDDKLKLSLV